FGKGHTFTADTAAVDSVLKFVGFDKTALNGKILQKQDIRTQFNFSAIAKGFGCDKVGEMLKRNGVSDYIVEIGGEISLSGNAPGRSGWRVAIDKPVESAGAEHQQGVVVNITDCGLATSGNYRNFHKEGKNTLGHTISPLTGRPVQTDVISATVMAPTCMEADGAATACMAAGSAMAKRLLNDLGYEGMLILADTTVWMSEGFRKL
ncbi:MAG: FAD:protein FMN transferase, partial [Muribaculaceae bacterium]|nr:FAD:protein FMN transferase [Muribaculaceae bacterium]